MNSKYVTVHLADLLRVLVIHEFGGTYLDSDIISLQPNNFFRPNFVFYGKISIFVTNLLLISNNRYCFPGDPKGYRVI